MSVEFSKETVGLLADKGKATTVSVSCGFLKDDPLHWSRCTVKGGAQYDKDVVLDTIIMRIGHIALLLPCLYQIEGNDSFFLFRHEKEVIERIEGQWLIHDPTGRLEELLEISFVFNYLTIEEETYDPIKNLKQVVLKRTNVKENVIDLRNLQNDADFKDVYVSFHSPLLLDFIVAFVKREYPNFELNALVLSHNCLEHLDMMVHLKHIIPFKVNTLDLRHNELTFSSFDKLPNFLKVKHLLLEGNPVCDDYESAGEMICEIAERFSSLEYLDNIEVNYIPDFPQKKARLKLFLRNPTYTDFVDHFLHHYFMLFETDRKKLVHTYHRNASLSVSVFQNELSITPLVPEFFALSNRNIMNISDITKTYDNIYIGKVKVLEALESMPKMKFDFHTFNVDVPVTAKGRLVVISCSGCFCLPEEELSRRYSLSRICILCPLRNGLGEWLILNDMWTILSISPKTLSSAEFSLTRSRDVTSDFAVMLNPFLKDKAILISVVSNLTQMKAAWVEKYLSKSGWDLEMTLLAFTDQLKTNMIPSDAFCGVDPPEKIEEDLEQEQQELQTLLAKQQEIKVEIMAGSNSKLSSDPAVDPLEGVIIDKEAVLDKDIDHLQVGVATSVALKGEGQQQRSQQPPSPQVHRTQHNVVSASSQAVYTLKGSSLVRGAKSPPLHKAHNQRRDRAQLDSSKGPLLPLP